MDDQDQVIHVKGIQDLSLFLSRLDVVAISVEFIKTRPTSDLELLFKDDTGVIHKSYKFKNGAFVHWGLDVYVRTHTSATLTIQRVPFKIRVTEVSVEFKPYKFGDDKAVRLEGGDVFIPVQSTFD
ncbi:hypothetical protein EDB86DRAFT_3082682 [Lactarius hatsudake]|nr:hypothetical protein EDB86DRAFT_3088633 [Lactarius hatsudake]KAH8986631.1 hypothetical protein EDB86DRAFT_3082682 [Lactarius hatsudake]